MAMSRRRNAAQNRARQAVAAQRRSERRSTLLIRSGILLAALAAVTAVALVLVTSEAPSVKSPRNLASDGIVIEKGLDAVRTPSLERDADPVPTKTRKDGKTVAIQLYGDYLCPNCGDFEKQNGDYLEKLVESGAATLEIHPIAILDRMSQGTKYPTRAAAAAVCVADLSPDSFFSVNRALFAAQPTEQSPGLSNAELAEVVRGSKGVTSAARIADCIDDQRFAPWVTKATKRAIAGHYPGTDVADFRGTPTVIVDGKQWSGEQPFTEFVAAAAGESATH